MAKMKECKMRKLSFGLETKFCISCSCPFDHAFHAVDSNNNNTESDKRKNRMETKSTCTSTVMVMK